MHTTPSFQQDPAASHPGPWRLLRLCGALLLALAVSACALEPNDALPAGAVAMSPSPDFAVWWSRTEQCSGIDGNFGGVQWYVVPGARTFQSQIGEVVGLWTEAGGVTRITIAGDWSDNELVVRHEMLHALLNREGHPPLYFVQKCALTWASWNGGQAGATSMALHAMD
jgi:hypothetical protein